MQTNERESMSTKPKKISIGEAIRDIPVKLSKTSHKPVDRVTPDPILGVEDHDDWWVKSHKRRNTDTWNKIQRWD